VAVLTKIWRRREPEATILYRVVAEHLETFLGRIADDDTRAGLPRFVVRDLRDFLRCGILACGFCRVFCTSCRKDMLVAFSCKRRGFCPSCGSRRMADTAAWLVDRVFPDVPVRQWVLSLPYPIRFLCAFDPTAARGVRNILVRAVSSFYTRNARKRGIENSKAAAVCFQQRFDQSLRLNLHYHTLWTDGSFTCSLGKARADFHEVSEVTDADVARLVRAIRDRVVRFLRKIGKLTDQYGVDQDALDSSLHQTLGAAAVQGRIALGPKAGAYVPRVGQGSQETREFKSGPLCAHLDGFSLHAGVRVSAGATDRLEKLIRYAARPPVVEERLSLTDDGKVVYRFKTTFRDGSSRVVMDPLTFLERLASLVPRPMIRLVTYHGLFAPAAPLRPRVVPPPPSEDSTRHGEASCSHSSNPASNTLAKPRQHKRKRYTWAELMQRVFHIDVFLCECGGLRRLLAFITDKASIRRILSHLGLPPDPPKVAPARPPPMQPLPFA
jgi:hypothetical protein